MCPLGYHRNRVSRYRDSAERLEKAAGDTIMKVAFWQVNILSLFAVIIISIILNKIIIYEGY